MIGTGPDYAAPCRPPSLPLTAPPVGRLSTPPPLGPPPVNRPRPRGEIDCHVIDCHMEESQRAESRFGFKLATQMTKRASRPPVGGPEVHLVAPRRAERLRECLPLHRCTGVRGGDHQATRIH